MSHRQIQLAIDANVFGSTLIVAYLLRLEFVLSCAAVEQWVPQFPFVMLVQLMALSLSGAQGRAWRYTSLRDLPALARAVFSSTSVCLLVRTAPLALLASLKVPLSIIVTHGFCVWRGRGCPCLAALAGPEKEWRGLGSTGSVIPVFR